MLLHPEEPSSVLFANRQGTLELVILGDDAIEETSLVMELSTAAETMRDCGDIPTVQMKARYEELMQNFIDWLVLHRRGQLSATMRKRV